MRKQSEPTKNRLNKHIRIEGNYVYAHAKENGEIFYIGKGKFFRGWSVSKRRDSWYKITRTNKWYVVVLADKLTEQQANAEELEVITHFAKFNKLVNHNGIVKWTKN